MTVTVPHENCEGICQIVELYRDNDFLYRYELVRFEGREQSKVSFSGLTNGHYTARFSGPGIPKEKLVVKIFEVNHYAVSAALKVFILGFAMFAVLLMVLYQRTGQSTN